MRFLLPLAFLLAACSSSSTTTPTPTGATPPDDDASAPTPPPPPAANDAGPADAGLTGACADTFGSALTAGFGRIDGVVYAVQKPSDTQCVMPNKDHVVVQVLMNGAVYRMVVNVSASAQDPTIRTSKLDHALPPPAFAEGWHTDAPLDYVTALARHASDFQTSAMSEAVDAIAKSLQVGDLVSVYATSGDGRPESAHLVHRNKAGQDGAIVVHPTTQPTFLLFAFGNQTF
jgi:hypothetical protein